MGTTRSQRHLRAPRSAVYRALLDPVAIAQWKVPDGMTSRVHEFEPCVGGRFRVSLTYDSADAAGKTSAHTDTYHGTFADLEPDRRVVEVLEFETEDPALQGLMTITTTLTDAPGGGTDLAAVHEGLPSGVPPEDNELGWRMSLARLAKYLEP